MSMEMLRNPRKLTAMALIGLGGVTLASCASDGLGGNVRACQPNFDAHQKTTSQEVAQLVNYGRSRNVNILDPSARQGANVIGDDFIDEPGEVACYTKSGSLDLTTGGEIIKQYQISHQTHATQG